MINLSDAGRHYLETSSRTPMEIMLSGTLLGYLATRAYINRDENVARVQAGDVHIPS